MTEEKKLLTPNNLDLLDWLAFIAGIALVVTLGYCFS